jgi:glycerol kinase
MNTGEKCIESKNGLIATVAASVKDEPVCYALEGSVFVGGAVVQWLRDELGLIKKSSDSEKAALKVADSGGVYIVPAFAGLGAPHWDMSARGTITGLTRGSGRNHIIRATLESLAYQTYDVLDAMTKDADTELTALKVDGGACANNFLMQFQSDIINTAVRRPKCIETTALGAAYLAGLAVGYWENIDEIRKNQQIDRDFEPKMNDEKREELINGWKETVQRIL